MPKLFLGHFLGLQAAQSEDGEEDTCRSGQHARRPLQGEDRRRHRLFQMFKHDRNFHLFLPTDAEPDVRHRRGGAGLQGGAGLAHPQPREARGGAEGGLQEPHAAPLQHAVHAELLHPTPAQGAGGEERGRERSGQVERPEEFLQAVRQHEHCSDVNPFSVAETKCRN